MEHISRQTDPYRQLGLREGASPEQVSRAYRRLVHESHPDTHQDDPAAAERLRAVVEAHDWIVERIRRAEPARADGGSTVPVVRRDPEPAPVAFGPPLRAGPVFVQARDGDPVPFLFRAGPVVGPLRHERGRR